MQQITGRFVDIFQEKIYKAVVDKFDENGLTLGDLTLRNITFSDDYIKAIEARKVPP